ncbi:MAG TPA: hypothetical protein VGA78_04610 [Gemmatimonadales bacterium]
MKRSEEEYRALAKRAAEQLLKLPGVHSVGIGGRVRHGQPTGELVVKVFVTRKMSPDELPPNARVPPDIEGLPTDVEECPPFENKAGLVPAKRPFPDTTQAYLGGDKDRVRPVKGGTELQAKDGGSAGTLGFMARVPADPKRIMAVTNHHVLFDEGPATLGRLVGQAEPTNSSTKCCKGLIGNCLASHYDADVDAALVQLDAELEWVAEIKEIGFIRGRFDLTTAEAQTQVYQIRMRGRTLGLVGGTLRSINTSGTAGTRSYTNGIVIKPNPDATLTGKLYFGDFGDSGAALVNDQNDVVGLYTSGPISGAEEGFGKGFPIKDLIDKFKNADSITIEVASATRLGQVQTVPRAAAANAAPDAGLEVSPAIRRLQTDLDRTPQGRDLIAVWLHHSEELNRLVNTERRVAAAWRRANGPEVFRRVIAAAEEPINPLPSDIGGRPAAAVLDEFLREVERYATPALRRDLQRHRPLLASLPGRTYDEVMHDLH